MVFVLLRYTVIGRILTAIGSDEVAVRPSGISINRYHWLVYGFGVGCYCRRCGRWASLRERRGSAVNTFPGVIIPGMIGNIMNLKDVPACPQQIIEGTIILAVLLQHFQK